MRNGLCQESNDRLQANIDHAYEVAKLRADLQEFLSYPPVHLAALPIREDLKRALFVVEINPAGFFFTGKLARIIRIKESSSCKPGAIIVQAHAGRHLEWLEIWPRHYAPLYGSEQPGRHTWEILHEYDKPDPVTPDVNLDNVPEPDAAAVAAYQERQAQRKERLENLAEARAEEANRRHEAAHDAVKYIPPGQPILVGHHSERGHRAALKRYDNHMRKAIEASEEAKDYQRRADTFDRRQQRVIRSEDPEALVRLAAKIKKLEDYQEKVKATNKIVRGKASDDDKRAALLELGYKEDQLPELLAPDPYTGKYGVPSYVLKNNGANIRRLKQRFADLKEQHARPETSANVGRVVVSENAEYNSVEISFPGKPAEDIRADLKRNGWRWARRSKVWYKKSRTDAALEEAKGYAARFEAKDPEVDGGDDFEEGVDYLEIETAPEYEANMLKPFRYAQCVICGREVKNERYMVHVHDGGGVVVTERYAETLDDAADLGLQPIGADCLKKHPEYKPFVKEFDE